jgi:hypothetical protein
MAARTLTPLSSDAVGPRPFLVYDFEWFPETLETRANRTAYKIRIASVYDPQKDETYSFAHPDYNDPRATKSADPIAAFVKALLVPRYSGYRFFAHWGGIADVLYLFRAFFDLGVPIGIVVNGSSASIVKIKHCARKCGKKGCKHRRYEWTFVDSSFLFRVALSKLGDLLGMKKGGDGEISWNTEIDTDLTDYNLIDNKILARALDEMQKVVNNLGANMGLTMSATAIDLFRRRYLKEPISTPEEANDFAKEAYYASRVEGYKYTMAEGESYDVNSSFVYSMTHTLPGSPISESYGKLPTDLKGMWIADCDVEVPPMYLPPLPYRNKKDGRIFFPVGKWSAKFTSVDIELALSVGCKVTAVRKVIHYEERTDLKDYAEAVYAQRMALVPDKGQEWPPMAKFLYELIKLLGNGAYGKFGETEEKVEYLINPEFTHCQRHYGISPTSGPYCLAHGKRVCKKCETICDCMTLVTPGIWRYKNKREIQHRHTQVVSFITSIARRTLYQGQHAFMKALHYSDTDCLHLDCKMADENRSTDMKHEPVDGKKLGGFKHEGGLRKMVYIAPKIYGGEDHKGDPILRAKGFRIGGKVFQCVCGMEKLAKLLGCVAAPKAHAKGCGIRFLQSSVEKFRAIIDGRPVYDSRMVRPKQYLKLFQTVPRPFDVVVGIDGKRLRLQNRPKRKQIGPNESTPWTIEELTGELHLLHNNKNPQLE